MLKQSFEILQQEQIDLGRNHGLTKKQINVYAKKKYNFLQMQEIRFALENGCSSKDIRILCDASLSHEEMEKIRKQIEEGKTFQTLPTHFYQLIGGAFLIFLLCAFSLTYHQVRQRPYLTLNTESITLRKGEPFEAMDYIQSYSNKEGILSLPTNIETTTIGKQIATYKLITGHDELLRTLIVIVEE